MEYVEHILKAFGPDRVLFAGDWPVCTLARGGLSAWISAVEEQTSGCTPEDRAKLFSQNARRVYRLG